MEKKYYFNTDYTIRKDGNRYLLYSRFMKKYDSDTTKTLIHPYHARLLSLFSAGCPVEQAANMIASDLSVTQEDAKKILAPWLSGEKFRIAINDSKMFWSHQSIYWTRVKLRNSVFPNPLPKMLICQPKGSRYLT